MKVSNLKLLWVCGGVILAGGGLSAMEKGNYSPVAPYRQSGNDKSEVVVVKPEVNPKGIFFGSKGIEVNDKGAIKLTSSDRRMEANLYIYFATPHKDWITSVNFADRKLVSDLKTGVFTFSGRIPLDKADATEMPYADYTHTVKLNQDNTVDVSMEYKVSDALKKNILKTDVFFEMPLAFAGAKKFLIDDKEYCFPEKLTEKNQIYAGIPKSFVFTPDAPDSEFSIRFNSNSMVLLREGTRTMYFLIKFDKKSGTNKLSFTFDMSKRNKSGSGKSKDTHAGIDFWKSDRLHVPDYSKTGNLIQNPSFEADLRYFILHDTWAKYRKRPQPVFAADDTVAKFGRRSLKINCLKDDDGAGYLQTFAIPVEQGKKYTVSFYIKGNRSEGLNLRAFCVSAEWLKHPHLGGCQVTDEWKRHSFTFTAPNRGITILLGGKYSGSDNDAVIWLDGLQLEQGDKTSDFASKPVDAILRTSNPDNFLSMDQNVDAKLEISAPPNSEGKVECSVENYFYAEIWRQDFSFKTDNRGLAVIDLPLNGKLGEGIYILKAGFKLKNGYADTDYFRISRMNFLDNKHKNKDITASNIWCRMSRAEDNFKRFRQIGIGSTNYAPVNDTVEWFFDMLKENNISFSGHSMADFHENKTLFKKLGQLDDVSPEIEKEVEEMAYNTAKKYPWVNAWHLEGECEAGSGKKYKLLRIENYSGFAKLLMACYRGVKRFDKAKEVALTGGPCEMRNGIAWVDRYLTGVGGKLKFDAVCIHTYRAASECEALDEDTAKFLDMLKRHGYDDVPVYYNEGIYYPNYIIPEWDMNSYKGCSSDHYRIYCPSYHMGWGERISAALFARSWIITMKYMNRVKQHNGWCSWMWMDAYLTPLALQKIPNTIGHLLGNATYKKDIRFAPNIRCYVFEDDNKRPVSVVWSHIPDVDNGFKTGPMAEFKSKEQMELFDLMGNRIDAEKNKDGGFSLPLSPFPVFLRGNPDTLLQFCQVMENARLKDDGQPCIQVSGKPLNRKEMEISFTNLITGRIKGQAVINIGNKRNTVPLDLKGTEISNISETIPGGIANDRITEINAPIAIHIDGSKTFETDLSFKAFAVAKRSKDIVIDGHLNDWEGIPAIKLKNRNISKGTTPEEVGYKGDHEAEYKVTWDKEFLYLCVTVIDDVFHHKTTGITSGRWYNDSLQLYIDTSCNAKSKVARGFDEDDYNYNFFPETDGTLTVYRGATPNQQLAGGLLAPKPNTVEKDIKTAFKRTADGYIYEIAMPKKIIAPMQLKTGTVVGFALYINDHDGKTLKSALTTTPPRTGGFMNPHLYPSMILTE
jgi:hypothetical protein